jgi:RNA polymerase sigma-70 factor (ECF subfamily)
MIALTDDALLGELRRGDGAALREAYRRCQPRLLSYLARLCGEGETARDLAAETWCRAVGKLHALRPDSQLLPWLFAIGRNLFFSWCRWRSRDEHYLNEFGRFQLLAGPPPSPPAAALDAERDARLEQALRRLPLIYREAVVLVAIEGLSREQAAAVAGIRADAVRQRLSRGIRLLREALAPEDDPAVDGEKT